MLLAALNKKVLEFIAVTYDAGFAASGEYLLPVGGLG